jgi:hypothetical protein
VALVANTITANQASAAGGGLYVYQSDYAAIRSNIFASNSAPIGGGLYLYKSNYVEIGGDATTQGNEFSNNVASAQGGGLCLFNNSDIIIHDNQVLSNTAGTDGGGLCLLANSNAIVSDNNIAANTTGAKGGGLYALEGRLATRLESNTFFSNAAGAGGGIYLGNSVNTVVYNTSIVANSALTNAGGLYIDNLSPQLFHVTLADNLGENGIYIEGKGDSRPSVALTNTILSGHSVGIDMSGGFTLTLNGALWYDTPTPLAYPFSATVIVGNQYSGDPVFANPQAGDYHLSTGSAAIDKAVVTSVTTDIDRDRRPYGPWPDLGADEWRGSGDRRGPVFLPLVLGNHTPR